MTMRSSDELASLTRRELQAEAKQHGVKANLASGEIIKQLLALGAPASANPAAAGDGASQSPREGAAGPPAAAGDERAGAGHPLPAAAAFTDRADAGDLTRRLSKLSERIDRARLSLVSVQGADAADSEDELRRNSLDEELDLDFSPPKTTAFLPATPKEKLRGTLSIADYSIPKAESAACLQRNLAKAGDSVAKHDMCGTFKAASPGGRPWTPSQTRPPAAAGSPEGPASPPLPSSGTNSILKSAEYLRLRAERSERKRRRMEEGDEAVSSSSAATTESTQSFCKRIAGMCQQVASIVTPHKNLALSSQGTSAKFGNVAPVLAAVGNAQNSSSFPEARADARLESEDPPCPGTCPTTPSGLSRSAKVPRPFLFDCGCRSCVA
jgi:hypothetical protein